MLTLTDWRNRRYQTHDGRAVRIVADDHKVRCNGVMQSYLLGLLAVDGAGEIVMRWKLDGTAISGYEDSRLEDAPEERWVGIYEAWETPTHWNLDKPIAPSKRVLKLGPVRATRTFALGEAAELGLVIEVVRLPPGDNVCELTP